MLVHLHLYAVEQAILPARHAQIARVDSYPAASRKPWACHQQKGMMLPKEHAIAALEFRWLVG
jgi:hypothetical protein